VDPIALHVGFLFFFYGGVVFDSADTGDTADVRDAFDGGPRCCKEVHMPRSMTNCYKLNAGSLFYVFLIYQDFFKSLDTQFCFTSKLFFPGVEV
jgi:hypothetical protein